MNDYFVKNLVTDKSFGTYVKQVWERDKEDPIHHQFDVF